MTPRLRLFTAALFVAAMLPAASAAAEVTASVTCKLTVRKGKQFEGTVCTSSSGTGSATSATGACMKAQNAAFRAAPKGCFKSPKECVCTVAPTGEDARKTRAAQYKKAHPKGKAYLPDFERVYANDWGTEEQRTDYAKDDEARQGFPGVFDPTTGNIFVRPSPYESGVAPPNEFNYKTSKLTDKTTWVRRLGGHEQLAEGLDAEFRARKDEEKLRAFTLSRDGADGYVINWTSTGVNGIITGSKARELPEALRSDVLDALAHHTKLAIREAK